MNSSSVSGDFLKAFSLIITSVVYFAVISGPGAFAQKHNSRPHALLKPASSKQGNGMGAYSTGNYRNLFREAGHSEKEISSKIEAAFQQLFHGDSATQAIYFPDGKNENGPLAYVSDVPHNDIRSE